MKFQDYRQHSNTKISLLVALLAFPLRALAGPHHSIWRNEHHANDNEDFGSKCSAFQPAIQGSRLELIELVTNGSKVNLPYQDATCGGPGKSNAVGDGLCRIALYVPTSDKSGIEFEAWLPQSWNHRFLGTGNGGIGGCIDYASLVTGTAHGFATVASNNGHNGTGGLAFYQNPDVVHDFADRAVHTSVVVGKQIIEQFYGKRQIKSYYFGCSQGGRQGVGSALKYPNDFDGIVAGSPALDFNSLVSWRGSFYPLTGANTSTDFIKTTTWMNLIHSAVLRQCDHIDGVDDGIIEYPDLCDFDPSPLACSPGQAPGSTCLSPVQLEVVKKVYASYTYPNGTLIYPGLMLGAEAGATARLLAGQPFSDSQDWFRYVVLDDPSWNPLDLNFDDVQKAQQLNPFNIRAFPSVADLQPFSSKGGKILTYHGMQDQQITGRDTNRWFEYLLSQASSAELDQWIRYFRISGMMHCVSGPGAWMIGQAGTPAEYDPNKNILAAIVQWVEHGVAPETLEGTKLVNDTDATSPVKFTRKHCRYPKRNHYIGPNAANGSLPTFSTADEWICQ